MDDHPHHVVLTGEQGRHVVTSKHLDCCLADGCPVDQDHPPHCVNQLAGAQGKRGLELAEHLKAQGPNPHLTPAGA